MTQMPTQNAADDKSGEPAPEIVTEDPFPRKRTIVLFKTLGEGSRSITIFTRRPRVPDVGGREAKALLDVMWRVLKSTESPFGGVGGVVHRQVGRLLKEALDRTYELGATGDVDLEAFREWRDANVEMLRKLLPNLRDESHPAYYRWLQLCRRDLTTLLLVEMHERVEDTSQSRSARLVAAVAAGLLGFFDHPTTRQIVESVAANPIEGSPERC